MLFEPVHTFEVGENIRDLCPLNSNSFIYVDKEDESKAVVISRPNEITTRTVTDFFHNSEIEKIEKLRCLTHYHRV